MRLAFFAALLFALPCAAQLSLNGGSAVVVPGETVLGHFAPYYASGDAATTTTTGTFGIGTSGTIGACGSFAPSQGIFIAGAGAAGDYVGTVVTCVGTSLVVTPATSTSVTTALVQHDDTVSLQAAITSMPVASCIAIPDGTYRVNGPLKLTGTANARLLVPVVNYLVSGVVAAPVQICMHGYTPPVYSYCGGFSIGSCTSVGLSTAGAVITSQAAGGSLIGGYGAAGAYNNFTNVFLYFWNLSFRGVDNPNQTLVDAHLIAGLDVHNVSFDTNTSSPSMTLPSHTGAYALRVPSIGNGAFTSVRDTFSQGYYTCFTIDEHSYFANVFANGCLRAFLVNGMSHAAAISRVLVQNSTHGFVSSGAAAYLTVTEYDIEHDQVPAWAISADDISDSGNNINGWVGLIRTVPGSLNIVGGSNITVAKEF